MTYLIGQNFNGQNCRNFLVSKILSVEKFCSSKILSDEFFCPSKSGPIHYTVWYLFWWYFWWYLHFCTFVPNLKGFMPYYKKLRRVPFKMRFIKINLTNQFLTSILDVIRFWPGRGQSLPELVPGSVFSVQKSPCPVNFFLKNSPPRQILFLKKSPPYQIFLSKKSPPRHLIGKKVFAPSFTTRKKSSPHHKMQKIIIFDFFSLETPPPFYFLKKSWPPGFHYGKSLGPVNFFFRKTPSPVDFFFWKSLHPFNFFLKKSQPHQFFFWKSLRPVNFSEKVSAPPPTLCPVPVPVNFAPSLMNFSGQKVLLVKILESLHIDKQPA